MELGEGHEAQESFTFCLSHGLRGQQQTGWDLCMRSLNVVQGLPHGGDALQAPGVNLPGFEQDP